MPRRSSLVVLSVIAHAIVLALIVVVSIMATGAIPSPFDRVTFAMAPPVKLVDVQLPSVRPAARATPHASVESTAPAPLAPIEAPSTIVADPSDGTALIGPAAGPGAFAPIDGGLLQGGASAIEPPPPPPPPPPRTPVRVSSGIRTPAKIVNVDPVYPEIARSARVEGLVIIEATVDEAGAVQSVRVLKSVPLLNQAALAAVRQWRFTPTLLNGVPVPIIMTVTVNFALTAR